VLSPFLLNAIFTHMCMYVLLARAGPNSDQRQTPACVDLCACGASGAWSVSEGTFVHKGAAVRLSLYYPLAQSAVASALHPTAF
jgi:hypothetical protein